MLSITGLFFTMVFILNDAIKIKYKGNVGKYLELLFSDLFIFCPFGKPFEFLMFKNAKYHDIISANFVSLTCQPHGTGRGFSIAWQGSLFLASGGFSSWAPVINAMGTDGAFGGLAECDDRD